MIKNKFKRGFKKIKWSANDILFSIGIKSLNNISSKRRIIIYHGVTSNAKSDINSRFISTNDFEKQIQYFLKNFNIVSITDYFAGASHPSKLTVAITFDDGYRNNLTEALPILEKYQVPATFYITTIRQANYTILWADALDLYRYTSSSNKFVFNNTLYEKQNNEYISSKKTLKSVLKLLGWKEKQKLIDIILTDNNFIRNESLSPYFQLLSNEEIMQLSKSKYAEIGSHGLYHNCLNQIPLADAEKELIISKKYLENIIQQKVTSFAYPDGTYSSQLIEIAEKIGYHNQLIVDFKDRQHINDNRIERRIGINPYISFNNQINCIIEGKY